MGVDDRSGSWRKRTSGNRGRNDEEANGEHSQTTTPSHRRCFDPGREISSIWVGL
jgi:hypothetical protein